MGFVTKAAPYARFTWIVLGDFNEILSLDEQWGRHQRSLPQMAAFKDALLDCSLQDLGYHGPHFTWSNRRGNHAFVRVRLDRGIANPDWLALFPLVQVHHVVIACSDHMGVSFDLTPATGGVLYRRRCRRFRFDKNWIREVGCEDQIKEAWNSCYRGTAMYWVAEKIKHCQVMLLQWSHSHVRLSSWVIEEKKKRLHQLECLPKEDYNANEVNMLKREVNGLVAKEEVMWRQNSRVT